MDAKCGDDTQLFRVWFGDEIDEVAINVARKGVWIVTLLKLYLKT